MAAPVLASTSELSTWLGKSIDDQNRAQALLEAASSVVRAFTGMTFIEPDSDPEELAAGIPDAVGQIVVAAAARVYRNPAGVVQETVGPFSRTLGGSEEGSVDIYLKASEKATLRSALGITSGGLGGLQTIKQDASADRYQVPASGLELTAW